VRNKVGRALQGWKPYENWANAPGGVEEEYLFDDGLRLHDETSANCGILSVQDGLLRLRKVLSSPGSSVRLVGLSGVGKTRLVQALFDERTEEQTLAPALAIYTDISASPAPEPGAMAEQLIALRTKAVLIIDNCPPDLHRRLTKTCTQSNVSLLTFEYDVRDDLPEETSVFKLEPASDELICKLLRKRFSHITRVGRFLLRTSLDEFPQFINVLKGEMSVVGARPIVGRELEEYYKGSGGPSAGRYVSMKPGITGLWQVSKRSDTENYQERIELDDWYVLNHSLTGDLKIILKTVGCMISGKGAY